MKKFKIKILQIFLFKFFTLVFLATNSFATTSRNLTVFAEPNTVVAMTKIAHLFSQQYNVITSVTFSSASDSVANIDLGEPADVFISAHPGWIENLRQKGLVDVYNIGYIARDEIALTTLKSNPTISLDLLSNNLTIQTCLKILEQNRSTLIIDDNGNSSGKFGEDVIQNSNLTNLKIFRKLPEDRSPILEILRNDDRQYALLLASQVRNEKDFKILATDKNNKIFYQALVIAGDNMEVAREFLKFLRSKTAKKILRNEGFIAN